MVAATLIVILAVAMTPAEPGDAVRAFDCFINPCGATGAGLDANGDGAVTPADGRRIYERYLLDSPAHAPDFATRIGTPLRLHLRHRAGTSLGARQTRYQVSVEVDDVSRVSAFGLVIDYPAGQLALREVLPGEGTGHWIACGGSSPQPGRIVAGGFNTGPAVVARPGQLLQIEFDVLAPVDGRRIDVRLLVDDIDGAAVTSDADDAARSGSVPAAFRLVAATGSAIDYAIPAAAGGPLRTRITVHDRAGRIARVLVDDDRSPGFYTARWDGRLNDGGVAGPGVYYVRLSAGDYVASRPVTAP